MNRKDRALLNKLRTFPKQKMDRNKQEEIHENLLKMESSVEVNQQRKGRSQFIAGVVTVVALSLFSILGISYLQKDSNNTMNNPGETPPSVIEDGKENKDINDEINNDFVDNEEDSVQDIAWEPMAEEKIKFIINSTLSNFLLEVEKIQTNHPEWFEKFRLLHEGHREYPEEFYEAVDLFKSHLEPIFTKKALENYVEGLVLISFCECDAYSMWSESDTEKEFQVIKQTEKSFIATSKIEATEMNPISWKYEWQFKREEGSWKLDAVIPEEISD